MGTFLQAQAPDSQTAHFDDSGPATIGFIVETPQPFFYKELVWEGFTVIQSDHPSLLTLPHSGYTKGAVSGSFAIVAAGRAVEASLVRRRGGGQFVFKGAFLTAGWRTGLEVRLEGLVDGSVVYTEEISTSTAQPSTVRGSWRINELRITASGGHDAAWCRGDRCYPGPEVILDDFLFSFTSEEQSIITSATPPVPASQLSDASTTNVAQPAATELPQSKKDPVVLPPDLPERSTVVSAAVSAARITPTPGRPEIETTQTLEAAAVSDPSQRGENPVPLPPETTVTTTVAGRPKSPQDKDRRAQTVAAICHQDPYYGVQVGAFRSESSALALRQKIARSHSPVQVHKNLLDGKLIHRVIAGCGQQRVEARTLLGPLSQLGVEGYVVEVSSSKLGKPY